MHRRWRRCLSGRCGDRGRNRLRRPRLHRRRARGLRFGLGLGLGDRSGIHRTSNRSRARRGSGRRRNRAGRSGPEKLQEALSAHFGFPVRVAIEVGEIATVTPAQRNQAEKTERHAAAVVALEQDPFVRELIARFDATLEVASVKPL